MNSFRAHRSSGYGYYGSRTELTELSDTVMNFLQNAQKYRVRYSCCTELTKVSGTALRCGTRTRTRTRVFLQGYTRTPRAFSPLAVRHHEVIDGCNGVRRQSNHLSFRLANNRQFDYGHAVTIDYLYPARFFWHRDCRHSGLAVIHSEGLPRS